MHLLTTSYLRSFNEQFLIDLPQAKAFEAFCNYSLFKKYSSDDVEPLELIYEGADPGIDGVMLFLDDRCIFSEQELKEAFESNRRSFEVTLVVTQVKSGEAWSKKEIDSFENAVSDFLSAAPQQLMADYLIEARQMFFKVFDYIQKVKDGQPRLVAKFCSAGPEVEAVEIAAAFRAGKASLQNLGYFRDIEFSPANRDEIHSMWLAIGERPQAHLSAFAFSAFPAAPGIDAAYVVTVSAKVFVDQVLRNPDGSPRKFLFEENVRDFLGKDAEVNSEIAETLRDSDRQKRFGIMNNGITIVAKQVQPAGNRIFISDYQIVNGCQTSSVLNDVYDAVGAEASLMLKLIQTDEPDVIDDIVRATNRQSAVEDEQFISTMNYLKHIEAYFSARGREEANSLLFERRKGQYRLSNIAGQRLFDIREVARCYGAAYVFRPDLASRYVNRLTSEFLEEVFSNKNPEERYYVACFAIYRLKNHLPNRRIDPSYTKLRWHILTAASRLSELMFKVWGTKSREEALYSLFSSNDGEWFQRLTSMIAAVLPNPDISRDVIKNQQLNGTLLKAVEDYSTVLRSGS